MKVLVTGGSGFIGSCLIKTLLKDSNIKVLNIDKLTYASNEEALHILEDNNNYSFKKIDISNKNDIDAAINEFKPNYIMHLAAESHVDNSIASPKIFITTNIIGTYNLLESSRSYYEKLSKKNKLIFRFHHISTDEVYGDLKNTNKFFSENTPYNPSSPYSASKASSDHLVRAWFRTFKLPILITNCSNNYGPFQNAEKFIPMIINNALSGKKISIYGDGLQIRDWLHVQDHCDALLKVIKNGKIGQTYNIGGNNEIKNIDVVKKICNFLDSQNLKNKKSFSDQIEFVHDRPGHDVRYAIDASKIMNELKWKPKYSFDEGIKETVLWYLKRFL